MQKWWTEILMTERRKSIRGRKLYRNPFAVQHTSTGCIAMQKAYFSWIELQATARATSWNTATYNHSISGKQVWAFGLILVLIFGDSNRPWSLSPGSLYDPGLDLWHLYPIPLLISGLSNWSLSLSLGSVWSWSWSLGFLTDSGLEVGFSVWSSTWSLCGPCQPSLDIRGHCLILILIFWCSNYWASPWGEVGFVSLQPPEGRCSLW